MPKGCYLYCIAKKIRRSNRRIFRRYLRKYSDIPKTVIRRMKYKKLYKYDTNAQAWYDEAYENEIEIKRWKRI